MLSMLGPVVCRVRMFWSLIRHPWRVPVLWGQVWDSLPCIPCWDVSTIIMITATCWHLICDGMDRPTLAINTAMETFLRYQRDGGSVRNLSWKHFLRSANWSSELVTGFWVIRILHNISINGQLVSTMSGITWTMWWSRGPCHRLPRIRM